LTASALQVWPRRSARHFHCSAQGFICLFGAWRDQPLALKPRDGAGWPRCYAGRIRMAIDNPLDQALEQVAAEDRQRSPFAKAILAISAAVVSGDVGVPSTP
jgi:hypothetical protein